MIDAIVSNIFFIVEYSQVIGSINWVWSLTQIVIYSSFGFFRATLKLEDCFHYLETKAKFVNDKSMKKPDFPTAVDQIEQAIATGEDAAPLDVSIWLSATCDRLMLIDHNYVAGTGIVNYWKRFGRCDRSHRGRNWRDC